MLYCVYILTNRRNGALYVGVTSGLPGRVFQHREKQFEGFTKKYGIAWLVYYEAHSTPEAAITREKQIKKWRRAWKVDLIEKFNPAWTDLYEKIAS